MRFSKVQSHVLNWRESSLVEICPALLDDQNFQPVWPGAYCSVWVDVWVVIAVALGVHHTILEKKDPTIGTNGVGSWPCLHSFNGTHKSLVRTKAASAFSKGRDTACWSAELFH